MGPRGSFPGGSASQAGPVLRSSHRSRKATYYAYRTLSAALQPFPRPLASGIATAAGAVMRRGAGPEASVLRANLRRAMGNGATEVEIDKAVVDAYDSYAHYWVEGARLATISPREVLRRFSVAGFEPLRDALEAGNGAILALAHLGSWEFGGYWLTLQGFPMVTVAEPVQPPELYRWFSRQRELMGLTIVPFGQETTGQLVRALRSGRLVGLLCDRDLVGNGVEVDFFGEKTTLPAGPAVLSLRTGAPVFPAAVYQDRHGFHRGVICPPVRYERTGRLRDDVAAFTALVARDIERLIARAPQQWHVLQPNWPAERPPRR